MAAVFQGVELYRSIENLLYKDRAWCNTNATLRYSGTGESFADSGLLGNTQYYYKIFAKYLDGSVTSYSDGVMVSAVTGEAPPPYQQWENYPDSPLLSADYPYQYIRGDNNTLTMTNVAMVADQGSAVIGKGYILTNGVWVYTYDLNGVYSIGINSVLAEANYIIYLDHSNTTIFFDKTT